MATEEDAILINAQTGWSGFLTHRQVSTLLAALAVWRAMKSEPSMADDPDLIDLATNSGMHSEQSIAEIDDLSAMLAGDEDE